jgi:hypothetical protein
MTTQYFKASPNFIDLDHEEGGELLAAQIRLQAADSQVNRLILDLSGNVRLDYWGCSRLFDGCVELLEKANQGSSRHLTVLTSAIYELKKNYAWLFFYKSRFVEDMHVEAHDYAEVAHQLCRERGLRFDLYQVPLDYLFSSEDALPQPDFVLSSK